ncbi:MAG: thiamine pyrophosphate-binding protein [Bacteriovoracaceae bacterium]|nr:thiamine pyrophosphate-binding protein [Bacteriovoracaceae bacterium]
MKSFFDMISEVSTIFFCSGARNQYLLPLFENKIIHFENDERIASFKALGLAKITKQPVVICTTSGTAVAECLPAMLEAYYSEAPLILISGDRPKKLHLTGAPQTTRHELITQSAVRGFAEIEIKLNTNLNLKSHFSALPLMQKFSFPFHLNVLIEDGVEHQHSTKIFDLNNDSLESLDSLAWASFDQFLKNNSSPLFLISGDGWDARPLVQKLIGLGVDIYAESLSWAKSLLSSNPKSIKDETQLLEAAANQQFTSIVRIGHTPLSKLWRNLEKTLLPTFSFDPRGLAGLSYGNVIRMTSQSLFEHPQFWEMISKYFPLSHQKNFPPLKNGDLSEEQKFIKAIHDVIPDGSHLFLGNSLIIRNFEKVQTKFFKTYGNRGLNGIDGQLSTAIGMANSLNVINSKEKFFCLLGDMTTLYDLSALLSLPENFTLIIINNKGGRIFQELKMDSRLVLEHEFSFQKFVEAAGKKYQAVSKMNHSDLEMAISHAQVIEVFVTWPKIPTIKEAP